MEKYEQICPVIDGICLMNDAFTCREEDGLFEDIRRLTNSSPCLCERRIGEGRVVFYASMISKLLLAYLLSEIKEGNLLSKDFLGKIAGRKIDPYDDFEYYNCNLNTAEVLETIIREVICRDGYFKIRTFDICDPIGASIDEESLEELLVGKYRASREDAQEEASSIYYYKDQYEDFYAEGEEMRSEILERIALKENKEPTDLGKEIIAESLLVCTSLPKTFSSIFSGRKDGSVFFFYTILSSIWGDDCLWGTNAVDRHHRYNYSDIFRINGLIEKIKEYDVRYLSGGGSV